MKKPLGLTIEPHPSAPNVSVIRFAWMDGEDYRVEQAGFVHEPPDWRPEVMAEFLLNFAYALRRKAR